LKADGFNFRLNAFNHRLACSFSANDAGDVERVLVDVVERVRRKTKTGNAGLENLSQGFHAIRDGGDDEIRARGKDLISFGRP
jgi:hypothetical protein